MGKTGDLYKKIGEIKGNFYARVGSIKYRNGTCLTEAEVLRRDGNNTQKNYTRRS